ncbi:hypothetical protein GG804_25275 [Sphingomonas histidinilytica]|uniref:hypothetical protein n=1 Tax=Rhizorhabdus histidinilytica TaxID=439228 RepID=UPI001AD9F93E|nr:hypothetical protein [Rhizorhabdus histidinilytica]MBO9380085.1 hypothetical protein [Rhizorhabdus histidinilytica]
MTVVTRRRHTIVDAGPNAVQQVSVSQVEHDGEELIEIQQGDDVVWMSYDHARAVAGALCDLAAAPTSDA